MKEESIKKLLQDAEWETSDDFTLNLMEVLALRLQRRVRVRLHLLAGGCLLFMVGLVCAFVFGGFEIPAFGTTIILPKAGVMVSVSVVGTLLMLHLRYLSLWIQTKEAQTDG